MCAARLRAPMQSPVHVRGTARTGLTSKSFAGSTTRSITNLGCSVPRTSNALVQEGKGKGNHCVEVLAILASDSDRVAMLKILCPAVLVADWQACTRPSPEGLETHMHLNHHNAWIQVARSVCQSETTWKKSHECARNQLLPVPTVLCHLTCLARVQNEPAAATKRGPNAQP